LDDLIKEIEKRQVEERILPLLPEAWHKELHYFVDDEFKNKVLLEGQVTFVTAAEMNDLYNHDSFSPVDGEMIKGATSWPPTLKRPCPSPTASPRGTCRKPSYPSTMSPGEEKAAVLLLGPSLTILRRIELLP
jgi:hypothetical protein